MFISNLVFSTKDLLDNLTDSYNWQSSYLVQFLVSENILKKDASFIFSNKTIIDDRNSEKLDSSILHVAGGMCFLKLVPISFKSYKSITNLKPWFTTFTLIKQAIILSAKSKEYQKKAVKILKVILKNIPFKSFSLFDKILIFFTILFLTYTKSIFIKAIINKKLFTNLFRSRVDLTRS